MKFKPVILIIGILVFAQIMFYNHAEKNNIKIIDRKITRLDGTIRQLSVEKTDLINKFNGLKEIIATIPPYLLMGFEDPETGFVEFLDYLQTPLLQKVEGEISLRETQKFKEQPVPLHESKFAFKFNFFQTYEAEKFFNYLLLQKQFPLQVKSLKITRSGENKADGNLIVSLLIPAKLQLSSLSQEKEGQ